MTTSSSSSGSSPPPGETTEGPAATPATCQEVLDDQPGAQDGEYTLYVGGDVGMPWTAHCAEMSQVPREYLPLPTGGAANYAQYTAGGASQGQDVRTSYTRVRIDPVTLEVDPNDLTFSQSTGQLQHDQDQVTTMPYGLAMSCDGGASGEARIDLSQTPFVVEVDFCQAGWQPEGGASSLMDGRIVEISGGGFCGWVGPANPCPGGSPYNGLVGTTLPLAYTP